MRKSAFLKKRLKLAVTIAVLICLCCSVLSSLFFDTAQIRYRTLAHEGIAAKKGLSVIRVPLKDFSSYSDRDEIWYEGKLYDISSYTIENKTAIVTVLHDSQEETAITELVSSLDNNADKYSPSTDNSHAGKNLHNPPVDKIVCGGYVYAPVVFGESQAFLISISHQYFPAVCSSVIKPPPRSFQSNFIG